jgi:hypothetical protein
LVNTLKKPSICRGQKKKGFTPTNNVVYVFIWIFGQLSVHVRNTEWSKKLTTMDTCDTSTVTYPDIHRIWMHIYPTKDTYMGRKAGEYVHRVPTASLHQSTSDDTSALRAWNSEDSSLLPPVVLKYALEYRFPFCD